MLSSGLWEFHQRQDRFDYSDALPDAWPSPRIFIPALFKHSAQLGGYIQDRDLKRRNACRYLDHTGEVCIIGIRSEISHDLRCRNKHLGNEPHTPLTLTNRQAHAHTSLLKSCRVLFKSSGAAYRMDMGIPVVVIPDVTPSGLILLESP